MSELARGARRHSVGIGAVLVLAILASIPLAKEGIANADDILPTIYRVFSLHASWQAGTFYPRLSSDLAYAYGVPLFQFYPPLASYVAELFHVIGFGFISAIKVTYFLGLVCAGLGMYACVVRLYGSRAGALLAAVAYMYAPYYFVDIYTRGAMAEALALALLPWVLWTFYNLHQTEGLGWFVLERAAPGGVGAHAQQPVSFLSTSADSLLCRLGVRETLVAVPGRRDLGAGSKRVLLASGHC